MKERQQNPYESPADDGQSKSSKRISLDWLMPYVVICLIVGLIPCYGFWTHTALDGPNTVLWLILAWLITIINFLTLIYLTFKKSPDSRNRFIPFVGAVFLLIEILVGYDGIGRAIAELWALVYASTVRYAFNELTKMFYC